MFTSGAQAMLKAGRVGKDAGVVGANETGAFLAAAKTPQWDREAKARMFA
jgi:catalase